MQEWYFSVSFTVDCKYQGLPKKRLTLHSFIILLAQKTWLA